MSVLFFFPSSFFFFLPAPLLLLLLLLLLLPSLLFLLLLKSVFLGWAGANLPEMARYPYTSSCKRTGLQTIQPTTKADDNFPA